jgi:ribosomal protein S18 acetylase RimI-like enzyme
MAPDEKRWAVAGPWFFGATIRAGQRWGEVYTNDDASAAAVWFPPDNTHLSTTQMLRVGIWAMPFKVGLSGASRMMKAISATEKLHEAVEGPHWYLMALGTKPDLQGTGFGSQLIMAGTKQADAAGLPSYLETATENNVAFYKRRGFEVTGEVEVYGFTLWGMVRQPQPVD